MFGGQWGYIGAGIEGLGLQRVGSHQETVTAASQHHLASTSMLVYYCSVLGFI